jgi:hypothetical protein
LRYSGTPNGCRADVLALAFRPGWELIECFAAEQSLQYLRIFDCVVKQILASEEARRAIAPHLPDAMALAGGTCARRDRDSAR